MIPARNPTATEVAPTCDVRAVGSPAQRALWLDWQRGLAVLYMVTWHTWDSWRADTAAQGTLHAVVNLIGGLAAPSFLYMAGLSQVLGDAALQRKGVAPARRRLQFLRRGLWLLGVAYLFRVAEYLLGGAFRIPGAWQGIFKVDVLNVIAVSFIASAVFTVGTSRRVHVVAAVAATAAVVFLAPIVAGWRHAPNRVLDYLYCEWPRGIFYLFPWAAFAFAGSALGALVSTGRRPRTWLGIGVALFAGGVIIDRLPPVYSHQDFWHTSPAWVAMRLGTVVATSGALQLVPGGLDRWLSWLRTMGRHSLLGYFLSVELPYGVLTRAFHRRLAADTALLGVVAMIVVTWAASHLVDRRRASAPRVGRPVLTSSAGG